MDPLPRRYADSGASGSALASGLDGVREGPRTSLKGAAPGPSDPTDPQALDPVDLPAIPFNWTGHERLFIHICLGQERPSDLVSMVEREANNHGMNIFGIRIDPINAGNRDLLKVTDLDSIIDIAIRHRVVGAFASPPCSSIAAVRHRPLGPNGHGPRPLRSRI